MIQTYDPAGPGMIICVSGGKYVLASYHLAAMEEKDKRIKQLEAELQQWRNSRDGVMAENEALAARNARLKELLEKIMPDAAPFARRLIQAALKGGQREDRTVGRREAASL